MAEVKLRQFGAAVDSAMSARMLASAAACLGILYFVDAYYFNSVYFNALVGVFNHLSNG